jgi:GlpG protein
MREIASFEDERTAKAFADVLCARNIGTEVSEKRAGGFAVWVLEEGDLEASRAAWAAFDADPSSPEVAAAAGCRDAKRREREAAERKVRSEVIDVRRNLRVVPSGPATATLALVMVSVGVTLLTTLSKREDLVSILSIGTGSEPSPFYLVAHGQVWRLVTPIFVHYGLLHIFFNMWWLMDLGSVIEHRIGTARFVLLVLVTAVFSNAAQYWVTGSPFFGGMSGVLYALFGYLWVRGRFDPVMGLAIRQSTAVVLMLWLVLGFTGSLGNVANIAHLGGLLSGALLGARAAFSSRR